MYIVFARETKCLIMEKQANNKTYAYMYAYFRKKALSFLPEILFNMSIFII